MKVIIIGGGAAGMLCAATVVEQNQAIEVVVIEKNSHLGKKVLISGGGRCNVTTGLGTVPAVLKKYPRGSKFLTTAMHRFPPAEVRDWFERHSVPLVVEEDGRVFPASGKGTDVVGVFEKLFQRTRTQIVFNSAVKEVSKVDGNFTVVCKDGQRFTADCVVLTSGGQAYRSTGSTGEGYAFAEKLGHHITPVAASLNSFIIKEEWARSLKGVSLPWISLSLVKSKKQFAEGPIVFTHSGVSGPAVFALSSLTAFESYSPASPLPLLLNCVPNQTAAELEASLTDFKEKHPKKSWLNCVHQFVPRSLATIICALGGFGDDDEAGGMSKAEVRKTVELLQKVPLHAVGRGAGEEFVTAGGVDLAEVSSQTMESKVCPGLYLAGEILDVDGFTGGYNLQAAWCTGRLAGESILKKERPPEK